MAQGTKISVIEQHVEKGVLVLCAIGLLVAFFNWVAKSPRAIDRMPTAKKSSKVGWKVSTSATLPPEDVDEAIEFVALKVDENADEATSGDSQSVGFPEQIKALRANPFAKDVLAEFTGLTQPPAVREDIEPPEAPETFTRNDLLARIPAPPKPQVWVSRQLSRRPTDGGEDRPEAIVVAHLVATYPWDELSNAWQELLSKAATQTRVVVAKVEVKSEYELADGSWAPREVTLVHAGQAEDVPVVPTWSGNNTEAVTAAVSDLNTSWQNTLLLPDYWDVFDQRVRKWQPWTDVVADKFPDANVGAHDEPVTAEQPYRYAYRFVLINPLIASPMDVDEAQLVEAKEPDLVTPWSAWSDAVASSASTEFFVTSATASGGVRSVVYTNALGQEVEESFRCRLGAPIGGPKSTGVRDPISGGQIVTDVDFGTGAVAASMELNRQIYRGAIAQRTAQVIYLDAQGRLHSRFVSVDRARNKQRGK